MIQDLYAAMRAAEAAYTRASALTGGITLPQYFILQAVDGWPAQHKGSWPKQQDIVAATGIDRSTTADVMRRLVSDGLVRRRRNPKDSRAYLLAITREGGQALRDAAISVAAVESVLLDPFSAKHRSLLADMLSLMGNPEPRRAAA